MGVDFGLLNFLLLPLTRSVEKVKRVGNLRFAQAAIGSYPETSLTTHRAKRTNRYRTVTTPTKKMPAAVRKNHMGCMGVGSTVMIRAIPSSDFV